jgi:hypothetical protein
MEWTAGGLAHFYWDLQELAGKTVGKSIGKLKPLDVDGEDEKMGHPILFIGFVILRISQITNRSNQVFRMCRT